MPEQRKFIPTGLSGKGMNLYVKEMLDDLIRDVCEGSISQDDAIMAISLSDHMHLPQYIDIPRGIEGDHFIREVIADLERFIWVLTNHFEDYFELAKERYSNNERLSIEPVEAGVWITL